jgi:DNA-binding transcriptional LysR family regulator
MYNPTWSELELFLAVADAQSFSKAARALRIEQPTVSRRFLALEERLGTRLCERGVQGITLTLAGERLLPFATRMAEGAAEAAHALAGDEGKPEGLVRVAAPPGVAFDYLAPFGARLRKSHPGIRLEVLAGVEYLNLSRNEADLAIRTERPRARDLTVLFELALQARIFVSAAYAKELPKPYGLKDIDWIAWAPPYENTTPNPEMRAMIPDFVPVFTSDNYLVQLAACAAGVGAMILSKSSSNPGRLVELDFDLGPRAKASMFVVCSKRMAQVPRIAAVARLLRDQAKA